MASTGNAADFGDLTRVVSSECAVKSGNATKRYSLRLDIVFPTMTRTNIISFVTIATLGNAVRFW